MAHPHPPAPGSFTLFDERSEPGFRAHFVELSRRAREVDVALQHLRLDGVDLGDGELGSVSRIRLVLARVEAEVLIWDARRMVAGGVRSQSLRYLFRRLARGALTIRACPLAGWSPDFSVFHSADGCEALLGHHWFQRPYPFRGPALGIRCSGAEAERTGRRFQELWEEGHDVGPSLYRLLRHIVQEASRKGHRARRGIHHKESSTP